MRMSIPGGIVPCAIVAAVALMSVSTPAFAAKQSAVIAACKRTPGCWFGTEREGRGDAHQTPVSNVLKETVNEPLSERQGARRCSVARTSWSRRPSPSAESTPTYSDRNRRVRVSRHIPVLNRSV